MARQTSEAVDTYIGSFPPEAQQTLKALRELMLSGAPDAAEVIKWGHPSYETGTILFAFAGFAKHANFYCTPSTISAFAGKLESLVSGKGSVRCPYGQPIPADLLAEMVDHRVREYDEDGIRWM